MRSRTSVVIAAAMMTVTATHAAKAAQAHGRHYTAKKAVAQPVTADATTSAAIVAALDSSPPAMFAQPVAVIARRDKGSIHVTIETPPAGAMMGSGKGTTLASGTFGADGGQFATYPERIPPGADKVDPYLSQAAVSACQTLYASHALTTSFVIIVQPTVNRYDVIYSPIPYLESKTRVVPVTNVAKLAGSDQTQAAPPAPAQKPEPPAEAPKPEPPAYVPPRNSSNLTAPHPSYSA